MLLASQHSEVRLRGEMYPKMTYPDYKIIFCFVGITKESVSENGGNDTFDCLMRDVLGEKYEEAQKYLLSFLRDTGATVSSAKDAYKLFASLGEKHEGGSQPH